MSENNISWMEIGRVKNSSWFQALPEIEKQAVISAIEERTHASAVKMRAILSCIYTTVIYAICSVFWGMAFRPKIEIIILGFAFLGAIAGAFSGAVIARQKSPENSQDMQAAAGLFAATTGLFIAGTGLIAWIIRSI